jgi:lipopolysaccharide transport protein LptA
MVLTGEQVYLSFAEEFVSVKRNAEVVAEELKFGEHSKGKKTGGKTVLKADRADYDRKEGVILFDRNVHVDDEQYQMHADRLFVFLDGTNDLKRLVAIGHVAITNEEKTAYCARATYSKATGKIVMYSDGKTLSRLQEGGKKGSTVVGKRITFWINSEQVEVEQPVISMPSSGLKGADAKGLLKGGK